MSVTLTGTGGLATRLGKIGYALKSLYTYLGAADISAGGLKSVGVTTDGIDAQFASSRQDLASGLYAVRDGQRSGQGGYTQSLRDLAQSVLVEMVNDDTPLPSKTVLEALKELKRQMVSGSASFSRPTVSVATSAGGSNTGDGQVVASVYRPDGTQEDYVLAEAIKCRCTQDAEGGATSGQESFAVTSPTSQPDLLAWDWPKGSGVTTTLTAVDATQNASGGNLLYNSSFETVTNTNLPDNWAATTGSVGTHIKSNNSAQYSGTKCLEFAGDGSTLTAVSQPFNATPDTGLGTGGTSSDLSPNKVYLIAFRSKVSNNAATGVLQVALVNSSDTVINDAAGNPVAFTVTVDNETTSYAFHSGAFLLPNTLPSGYKIRLKMTTALSNGHSLYIDHLAMTEATQLYRAGPYVAVFSGATAFVLDDLLTATVSNDYGSLWALYLQRLFDLRALGVTLPSSGTPTLADSLFA